jgi:glucose/arabinose dehydrogenase
MIAARITRGRVIIALLLIAIAAALWLAKGHGLRRRIVTWMTSQPSPTRMLIPVISCSPSDGAFEVPLDAVVTVELRAPRGAIDPSSVNASTVMLVRTARQTHVPATVKLLPDGSIQIRPDELLGMATNYTLCITANVQHRGGARVVPWASSFTTMNRRNGAAKFEQVPLPNASGAGFTCLQVAPDRSLWASCDDGRFFVFPIESSGILGRPRIVTSLQRYNAGPRLVTGFCLDPASTPLHPIIWVCHNDFTFNNAPDFSGKVTLMAGPDLENIHDVVINLPRSIRDHMTNQPSIGPDGAVYFPQGSSSSYGAPDELWGMRSEHLLTATILRLDRSKATPGQSRDVRTPDAGGSYDPYSDDAPLTIYATGIRNAYDLCWHSNGQMYVPVNGSSAGGHTPASAAAPPLRDISTAQDDWLCSIVPGRFYGHPNPSQDHFVLNGGNPTSLYDVAETSQYPVGIEPDPAYVPPVYSFGKHISANGIIEYQGSAFNGRLKHSLLVCRYNVGSDVIALWLDGRGSVVADDSALTGLSNLRNPLDITEDRRNGNLYISEYGARQITLFQPAKEPL